ncbi:unnamed protein product [Echinostoma caproni]|uniref:Netrin receptor UNC5 n=1 Tax=Echinostoma caproni TaxID=27848 RepID=A0A183A858_9TREM|nr:unnamed protein product [Echinostoma caproni]
MLYISLACNTRVDVTQHFQAACDGRSSCSVSPSMADSRPDFTKLCGKMHLSLTYVCVPSEAIVTEKRADKATEEDAAGRGPGKGKKNQRQPKGVYDPKSSVIRGHKTSRLDETNSRDTRQLVNSAMSDLPGQLNARVSPKMDSTPVKMRPDSSSLQATSSASKLQPLFIALAVGLFILLIAMVFVIVVCRRKTRVPPSRKRTPTTGLVVKHTCDQGTSFWSTHRQTSKGDSWGGKKQPCSACHTQSVHTPSKLELNYDSGHIDPCRCGATSSLGSVGQVGGIEHSCVVVGAAGPVVDMQDSFHPCCNPSGPCSGHSPQPHFLTGGYGLPALSRAGESYPIGVNNVQYVVGLHTNELTKGTVSYTDQHSLSQSNSSSSGVGVNSAQMTVYGSPYPLGMTLGSSTQPGTRIDSIAYSTGHKESPLAESSSGRGCDGGSGTSEPSETFHFTCPRTKSGCHAVNNPLVNRPLLDYLPIPGTGMTMNSSEYMSRIPSQRGAGSPYDATSARSLVSAVSRPGRADTSPRPSFRSSSSTERNFTTPPSYLTTKFGNERALGMDYVSEQLNSRETYDQVAGYLHAAESELCNQKTLQRQSSQRGQYTILSPVEPNHLSDVPGTNNFDQGSSESLTVPLLEPPTNFRSPTKLLNSSEAADYIGLDADDDLSNSQSSQKPVDADTRKLTTRDVDGGSGDGIEKPPPPIAPLRVFSNADNITGLSKDVCYFSVR